MVICQIYKSPLISKVEKLKDLGGIVVNNQTTIIHANDAAHKILNYPTYYLYGKPISIIASGDEDSEIREAELLGLLEVTDKVVPRPIVTNQGEFIPARTFDGHSIPLASFYINDPISKIVACFFVECSKSLSLGDIVDNVLALEDLRIELANELKQRNIDYRLKKTYDRLFDNWKTIGIGIGSVLIFTTGVVGLFVSGFIGNRFGRKPSEYYDRLEERLNRELDLSIDEALDKEAKQKMQQEAEQQ